MEPLRGVGVVSLVFVLLTAHGGAGAEARSPRGTAVARWAAALSSADEATRRDALTALAALGPRARAALPAVTRALRDPSPEVRALAAEALSGMGRDAIPVLLEAAADDARRDDVLQALACMGSAPIPALLDALAAKYVRRRRVAAAVLRRVTDWPDKVRNGLIRALGDHDAVVRVHAAAALLALDPDDDAPLTVLTTALVAHDKGARALALEVLADLKSRARPAQSAVLRAVRVERGFLRVRAARTACALAPGRGRTFLPLFIEALAGRDEAACREACLALRDLTYQDHVESRFVLRAVLGVVKHRAGRRPETVRETIVALPFVTPLPRDTVAILAGALQDTAPAVAAAAAEVLARQAPGDPTAAAALLQALRHPAPSVRLASAVALQRFPGQAADRVPAYRACLQGKNPPRLTAILAFHLGEQGTAARAAVPALRALLADKSADVRLAAAAALPRIDRRLAAQALPRVLRACAGPDGGHDYGGPIALQLRPEGPAALLRALQGDDAELRRGALCAALEWELLSGPVRRALPAALRDKDADVRALAAAALVHTRRRPGDVVPALAAGLASRNDRVRRHALAALHTLGPRAAGAVPALRRLLQDDEAAVLHGDTITVLGRIGPAAAAAVPDLLAALADGRLLARGPVLCALGDIGPDDKRFRRALAGQLREDGASYLVGQYLHQFGPLLHAPLFRTLRDGDAAARRLALAWLRHAIDLDPDRVRSALAPILTGTDAMARLRAAAVLCRSEDKSRQPQIVLPAARYALKDPRASVRTEALQLLYDSRHWEEWYFVNDVVPLLLRARQDPSPGVRKAALTLLFIDTDPPDCLAPMLLEALDDTEDEVREFALRASGSLSVRAARVHLPPLLRTLRGEDEVLARAAAESLPRFVKEDRRVLPALLDVCRRTRSEFLRASILTAVAELGEPARAFLPMLRATARDEESRFHKAALDALAMIDPKDPFLPGAVARFIGREELDSLGGLSGYQERTTMRLGPEALPAFAALLEGPDVPQRLGAVSALGVLGNLDKTTRATAEPYLRRALADANGRVRVAAAGALWGLTKKAAPLLPVLTKALRSADVDVAYHAAQILYRMGSAAAPALPALVEVLRSPHDGVRQYAFATLGNMGSKAAAAVPALVRLLEDCGSASIRAEALDLLARIGKPARAALPALRELAQHPNSSLSERAIQALGKIGKPAEIRTDAVAILRQLEAGPEDDRLRQALAAMLSELGPVVVDDMTRLLKDRRADLRAVAARVLGVVGPRAKAALPALRAALKDKDEDVALAAAQAAWDVGRRREGAAVLGRLLASRRAEVRRTAVQALYSMGPAAADAVRALEAARTHSDHEVRRVAAEALRDYNMRAAAGDIPKDDK